MFIRFFGRVRHSFRYKLLLLVLLPLVVFIPALVVFTLERNYSFAEAQLAHKVHTDINVARASFMRQQEKYLQAISRLAESHAFYLALSRKDEKRIKNQLEVLKVTEGFDFLHVVDLKGGWLFDDSTFVGEAKPSPLIEDVVHSGMPRVGLEVYSSAYLRREHGSLARRARVMLADDGDAKANSTEQRALVVRAVYPLKNNRGQTVALMEGGVLLNHNAKLLGAIHNLVYGPGALPKQGKGLVSMVLDDVRVATNLTQKTQEEARALGSHIPGDVHEQVAGQGKSWVGELTIPGGRYLTGYQPLRDYRDNVIGMLEAGYLVAPLKQAYLRDMLMFGVLLLLIVVLATLFGILGARRIFKPIERMADVVHAQEQGTDLRIGEIKSRDEIGALARRFDHMLDLLHERNAEIQRAADNLEQQVEERTRELKLKNTHLKDSLALLRKTRSQLVMAEKFSALGELTAGIAHEINNPTAVILGNMDIIIEELNGATDPVETEVTLIYEQVYRIRNIVEKLLKYSRASPVSLNLEQVDVNKLVEDTVMLVRHEAERKHAVILTETVADNRLIRIDPQELQQVLINLLINAIHAVDERGTIRISTQVNENGDVVVSVCDDGEGIDRDTIDRIFDPFYSTKGNLGTGLGLSVSYGLIQRYGGNLEVSSKPGKGTVFTVTLRRDPKLSSQVYALFDLHSYEFNRDEVRHE
ncbi:MAG: ATP-binding protein [Thiohalophilus sp.]